MKNVKETALLYLLTFHQREQLTRITTINTSADYVGVEVAKSNCLGCGIQSTELPADSY